MDIEVTPVSKSDRQMRTIHTRDAQSITSIAAAPLAQSVAKRSAKAAPNFAPNRRSFASSAGVAYILLREEGINVKAEADLMKQCVHFVNERLRSAQSDRIRP
jgi:hypothetical protein